jgi:hypothetical protein
MNRASSVKDDDMEIETIQTDVSEADKAAAEAALQNSGDQGDEAENKPWHEDPMSRREAKRVEVSEARKAEAASERRQFWLMNNPEQTETDYDAMLNREQADDAGDQGDKDEGEQDAATQQPIVESKPADANGWETVNGQRVKTLMVNGEKRQITEEQYDRLVQKELAGDEKLRRAAQAEQELQRRADELAARERQLQERAAPKVDTGEILKAKIKEHSELLLEGDVDAANEKMAEILTLGRESSTPNLDDLTTQVATRVTSVVERKAAQAALDGSVKAGWSHLLENYPDVVGDEDAIAFADIQVKKVKAANPDWAPAQVIIEAGRLTREKLKLSGPATPGAGKVTSTDLTAQRMERKASIKPLPNAAARRHEKKPAPELDMSPSAKIARMRASRAL